MPHIRSEEYLVFERLHERERKMELQHQLAHQRRPLLNGIQRMIGSIGRLLIALGTRMQQVNQNSEHIV